MNRNAMTIENLKNYIKSQMSEKRFNHSLAVSRVASELAKIHNENTEDAEIAGLLHDLTREWNFNNVFNFLDLRNIETSEDEKNIPILLHGLVASIVIGEELGIDNTNIINSVKNHTLGREGMTNLEKIIYIADYIASAEGSDRYQPALDLAKISLDESLLSIFQATYNYLTDNNLPIAKKFLTTWDYYKHTTA